MTMLPQKPVTHPLPPNPLHPSLPLNPTLLSRSSKHTEAQTQIQAGPSRLPVSQQNLISPKSNKCNQCSTLNPKYTCPRCSRQTCSLSCSKSHKEKYDCSGIRDPTKYIPLKDFKQGDWAGDYSYLEESRRKINSWGTGLQSDPNKDTLAQSFIAVEQERLAAISEHSDGKKRFDKTAKPQVRGGVDKSGRPKSKVELMRRQLLYRGYWVEIMPIGMDRRRINQSSWNGRSQKLFLTVELKMSPDLVAGSSTSTSNSTLRPRVPFLGPSKISTTLSSLLPSHLQESSVISSLIFLLPFQPSPRNPAPPHKSSTKLYFPPLDPEKPLSEVLHRTAWIEYPTIHVITSEEWEKRVMNGEVGIALLRELPMKQDGARGGRAGQGIETERLRDNGWGGKRKLDEVISSSTQDEETTSKIIRVAATPPKAIQGLAALGGYESASDDELEVDDLAGEGEDHNHDKSLPIGSDGDAENDDGQLEEDEARNHESEDDDLPSDLDEDQIGQLMNGEGEEEDEDGDDESLAEDDIHTLRAVGQALIADLS